MNHIVKIILPIIALLPVLTVKAEKTIEHFDELVNNINNHLATIDEVTDSVTPLLNLLDLQQGYGLRKVSDSLVNVIYDVALRAGNSTVALEMLRHKANAPENFNGLKLRSLLKEAARFDGHPDQRTTETFIGMRINRFYFMRDDADSTQSRFQEQLRQITVNPSQDIYENILQLHAVCMHLSKEKSRELLPKYYSKLENLVDSVGDRTHCLENIVSLHAALAYTDAAMYDLALSKDKKRIELMDKMDAEYESKGRAFRDYGKQKYTTYRRMLSNWRSLSPAEMESIYKHAKDIVNNVPEAAYTDRSNPLLDIYYMMGHEQYAEVRPLIEKALERPDNTSRRSELLRDLLVVTKATGDKDRYIEVSEEYVDHLHNILHDRLQERYKELQVAYDINSFKNEINTLLNDKENTRNNFQRIILWISLSALLVLLILLFFLIRQYSHSRQLTGNLAKANEALVRESDSLRKSRAEVIEMRDEAQRANQFKTTFLRNLGREISTPLNSIVEHSRLIVDCADAANKPYLKPYADMIELNGDFITTILNDVLHLAQLDADSLSTSRSLVDLRKIAELVVETVSPELNENVNIIFDEESVNPIVYTDPGRVQQILTNLLKNAAKLTTSGTVTLQCNYVNQGKMVAISITDTGKGIDPKYKDVIFERFVKMSADTPGAGLGLALSRMVARLLGGDLTYDSNYTKGSRFVFTLPNTNN